MCYGRFQLQLKYSASVQQSQGASTQDSWLRRELQTTSNSETTLTQRTDGRAGQMGFPQMACQREIGSCKTGRDDSRIKPWLTSVGRERSFIDQVGTCQARNGPVRLTRTTTCIQC